MLSPETPFPFVGSYALLIDTDLPLDQQRAELVRILKRDPDQRQQLAEAQTAGGSREPPMVTVSFPLRAGASGTKSVTLEDLIDATPLTFEEQRELADLDRELRGKTRPRRSKLARKETLKRRALWAPLMARRLREAGEQRKAA